MTTTTTTERVRGRSAAPATRDAAERDALMLTDSPLAPRPARGAAGVASTAWPDALVDLTDSPPDAQTEAAVAAAEASLDRERDALIDLTDSPEDLRRRRGERAGQRLGARRLAARRQAARRAARRQAAAGQQPASVARRRVRQAARRRLRRRVAAPGRRRVVGGVSRPWVGAASLDDASLDDARPAARLETRWATARCSRSTAALSALAPGPRPASLGDASLDDAQPAALLEDALGDGARLRAFGDALRNSRTDDARPPSGGPPVQPRRGPPAACGSPDALGDGARRSAAFGALGGGRNSRPAARRVDMSRALCNPSRHELLELVDVLLRTGLWKVGGCYEDQIDIRPFSSTYEPEYYYRQGAILLARSGRHGSAVGLSRTAALQRAKFELGTGVNTKNRDLPDNYSFRFGALYADARAGPGSM
ncbi:hypothetical protein JL721_7639 [Aureococcus anophagefferens]|nr:hypothetical protein JL721_7639 [Aureococcus anophagefferens]